MRWIKTHQGDKAHCVTRRSDSTLCGINLKDHAGAIVIPGPPGIDRCCSCDSEWRKKGRRGQPRRERDLTVYRPVYKIEDWEEL